MKVIVCGCEHTERGLKEIRELQEFLKNNGYDIIHCTGDRDLSSQSYSQIIEKELEQLEKADVLILLSNSPDLGSAVKAHKFALDTKPVIVYNQYKADPDPWSNSIARKICRSKQELLKSIEDFRAKTNTIRVIPNTHGDHEAEFTYEDFQCICPVTGEKDRATIKISYAPHNWLIEYESLDSYFKQFADRKIHHEGVVDEIFNQLYHALQPKQMKVEAEFEPRSGVKARVERKSK